MLERIFTQIRFRFFDFKNKEQDEIYSAEAHITAALKWLRASLLPDGGVAAKYSMMTNEIAAGYPMAAAMWIPVLMEIRK